MSSAAGTAPHTRPAMAMGTAIEEWVGCRRGKGGAAAGDAHRGHTQGDTDDTQKTHNKHTGDTQAVVCAEKAHGLKSVCDGSTHAEQRQSCSACLCACLCVCVCVCACVCVCVCVRARTTTARKMAEYSSMRLRQGRQRMPSERKPRGQRPQSACRMAAAEALAASVRPQ